jgi:hypothetical protein
MNRKQLIFTWCGITAIVLAGLTVIKSYGLVCVYGFSVWVFLIALVTGGLVYTFKEEAPKDQVEGIRDKILQQRKLNIRSSDKKLQ